MHQIRSIHYLRGIAALLVVGFHCRGGLNNVYPIKNFGDMLFISGSFGVDLFFMISGFIITLSTAKIETAMIRKYVIKRFLRIYPLFILTLLFMFFFIETDHTYSLFRSALLIQADYTQAAPFFGYNMLGQAWTLTYEIYFYLIFMIAMAISHKYRAYLSAVFLIIPVFAIQFAFNGSVGFEGSSAAVFRTDLPAALAAFLRFISSPMLLEFVFGMMIYEARHIIKHIPKTNVLAILACSFVFCFYISQYRAEHGPFNFGLWGIMLVFTLIAYEMKNPLPQIKPLQFLGDISYSLYLTHIAVIMFMYKFGSSIPVFNQWVGVAPVLFQFIVVLTASYIIYNLVEKPSMKLARKLCHERFTKQSPTAQSVTV